MKTHVLLLPLLFITGSLLASPGEPPNFCQSGVTKRTSANGNWTANIWSPPGVPGVDDVVEINHAVVYDVLPNGAASLKTVCVNGALTFRTDINTRLQTSNLQVNAAGRLEVGTAAAPIASNVTAEIVFSDRALNLSSDPEQFGNGLIGLGKITMHGAVKSPTFVRLSAEPHPGDGSLALQQSPSGWQSGDRLFVPDSQQLTFDTAGPSYNPKWEEFSLSSVGGNNITVSPSVRFLHAGARDGNDHLDMLPHVGNLTRNVILRPENPSGVRAHTIFMHRAEVDIRYVLFKTMGRTRIDPLDNTLFDGSGNATYVGTNQTGRYPVHFCRLNGPANPPPNTNQFTFIGNAIDGGTADNGFRWGVALQSSHYGLIRENVIYNGGGAGIVCVDGSESFNSIERNLIVRSDPPRRTWSRADDRGLADIGHEGVGLWMRGFNNYIRDNVVSGAGSHGYTYFALYVGSVKVPAFQGADAEAAGQYSLVQMNSVPILEFARNESYGAMPSGMTIWWLGTQNNSPENVASSVIKDLHVWHTSLHGFFGYQTHRLIFDGFVGRGDRSMTNASSCGITSGDYMSKDLIIRNADIQNYRVGFAPSEMTGGGVQTIENSFLRNYFNIQTTPMATSAYRSDWLTPRFTVVRNVMFQLPAVVDDPALGPKYNIRMVNMPANDVATLIQRDQLVVYDYNGVHGDDFQVFYKEQAPTYVMPASVLNSSDSSPRLHASPEAGLTNAELWGKYAFTPDANGYYTTPLRTSATQNGVSFGGAVAPCNVGCSNAQPRPDINGYAFSVILPPALVFTSPRAAGVVSGTTVEVRYRSFGDQTGVNHIHLSIDGGAEVEDLDLDGVYQFANVVPGQHQITGYLARADHSKVPGTDASVSFRSTLNKPPSVAMPAGLTVGVAQTLSLSPTVSDDQQPVSLLTAAWKKISGPGAVVFANPISPQTNVTFGAAGEYTLELTVDDGELATTETVIVTVTASPFVPTGEASRNRAFHPTKGEAASVCFSNAGHVDAYVFDRIGRKVKSIVADVAAGGCVSWDGRNESNQISSSGLYFIGGDGPDNHFKTKLVLIK